MSFEMADVRILVSWKDNLQTGGSLRKDEISEKRQGTICNLPRFFRLQRVGEICLVCSQNSEDGQNSVDQFAILKLKTP